MANKRKKAIYQRKIKFIIIIFIILILLLVILLLKSLLKNKNDFYIINSRTNNIEERRMKDSLNYRTIGWIQVQGTNIDAPIFRGLNNSFRYPVELENYGWVNNDDDSYYNVMNIFGHNVFNLGPAPKLTSENFKRFEELMNFIYFDFAKNNKYIQLTMNNKDYIYKIFSVSIIYAANVDEFPRENYRKSEKKDYIDLLKENSIYDYDIDVNSSDDLISVITCTRFFGTDAYRDILISGRLVKKGEEFNDYSVKKNKNYKKIEEVLKGDDVNEEIGSA